MVLFLILIRDEFHGSFLIPFPVKKFDKFSMMCNAAVVFPLQ